MKTLFVNRNVIAPIFVAILLIIGVHGVGYGQEAPDAVVQFSDRSLAIMVRISIALDSQIPPNHKELLEMPEVDVLKIPKAELTKLTELTADRSAVENLSLPAITDLTGLEFATNLTGLNLEGNNLSDIEPVSGLTNLTVLNLTGNNLSDISPVSGLTNLTRLGLGGNNLSDISPVSGLTNLTVLDLTGNNLSDITPVSGLTNLTEMGLGGNNLSDISPVSGLTNLTVLAIWNNNLSDISPVSGLINLTALGLTGNNLSDISPVSGLVNLAWLDLENNSISDLSPLVANTGLGEGDEVYLAANPLGYASIYMHIPTLQERGAEVSFDIRMPAALVKISGDQHGTPGAALPKPLVVEVREEDGSGSVGVPVTFIITAGGGTPGVANTLTDANGRAESSLTLGVNPGLNTVVVSVPGVEEQVTFTAVGRQGVIIADSNLRAAVGLALGKELGDPISTSEIESLSNLDAAHSGIGGLAGLEFATNLTRLNLEGNNLSDISPVAGLTNLTSLILRDNNFSDISPVAGLTNLTWLELAVNNLSDISPVAGLTNLTLLDLGNNNLSDTSSVASLTNLTWLSLGNNNLSDFSPVAGLTNLTSLILRDNNLSDFSPVAGLTNLTALDLAGNNLSDVSPVAGLTNLTELDFGGNNLSDVSPVAGLINLTALNLAGNNLSDVSPVAGLTNLTWLSLANNSISDLSPLAANTGLGEGDSVFLATNLLDYASIYTHIPTLQGRGAEVFFDIRSPQQIRIVSGDDQQGLPGAALERSFVVEVQDENGVAFEGVPVTFTVTTGDGTLHTIDTATDTCGRAESILTLGPNLGTNTVMVSVTGIQEKQTFTAEGIRIPLAFWIISGDKQQGLIDTPLAQPFVVEVRDYVRLPFAGYEGHILGQHRRRDAECDKRRDGCRWQGGEYSYTGTKSRNKHRRGGSNRNSGEADR